MFIMENDFMFTILVFPRLYNQCMIVAKQYLFLSLSSQANKYVANKAETL